MNNETAPREYKLSRFSTYYIFALLFLLYFFDYIDRTIVASLLRLFKRSGVFRTFRPVC